MASRELSRCDLWPGARDRNGYGRLGRRLAHRLAYERANGPIPKGLCVLHRCDNPPCVNLDHLTLGTQADNLADMRAKGRARHPRPGAAHPTARLTDADVYAIRAADLSRFGSGVELARRFGITTRQMYSIRSGDRWSHLPMVS